MNRRARSVISLAHLSIRCRFLVGSRFHFRMVAEVHKHNEIDILPAGFGRREADLDGYRIASVANADDSARIGAKQDVGSSHTASAYLSRPPSGRPGSPGNEENHAFSQELERMSRAGGDILAAHLSPLST